jgi:hypothetical protein
MTWKLLSDLSITVFGILNRSCLCTGLAMTSTFRIRYSGMHSSIFPEAPGVRLFDERALREVHCNTVGLPS